MTELTNPVATPNGSGEHAVLGNVRPTDIINEMQDAYLDYAMSVIVARALPDVRDGLKPVHRRILYAVYHDLGLTHDKPHKKSARIVGEVLGKYHPHGDTAVYDAMVRMAQDFSLRYPLIDGQGNFGSVDGDNAAAMRYTEARLSEISNLLLDDLEKDTVNWHDNFDSTLLEPDILPAALPNLLINGSSGIAVGMSTNVPPHNLCEVVDALAYMIEHYQTIDDITVEQLMQFIQGPDFPTGGILYRFRDDGKADDDVDAIAQGYAVGKSRLVLQAKAHFEEMSRGRMRIVITELPYQTNKGTLLERIADLVRDGKIEGITDLRDESDRTGMRVVLELTRNVDPKDILADLFKYTPLQQTFGMQMLALVDGQPRTLSLKRTLQLFIQHREEIIRRRSEFDLARAKERAHIVEGLLRALDILDDVIRTIRNSQRVDTARNNLMTNFGFTEIQAQAILDMQLRRLAALERKRLQDEYKDLKDRIKYLEDLLAHPEKILALIKEDLLLLKEKYGDARRTQIVERTKGTLTTTDLLPDQQVWISLSTDGELRRQDVVKLTSSTIKQIGKRSEVALITANTRDYLYLFTKDGRCSRVAIHEIPQDGSAKHLGEFCKFGRRDIVTAALTLPRDKNDRSVGYLFFATAQGNVKRITLPDFLAVAHIDPTVFSVDEKDRLTSAFITQGDQEIVLVSAEGQAIRFQEAEVRSTGLLAGGVGGIKLKKGDSLVYAEIVEPNGELLTVTTQGYAKRSVLLEYPVQGRNGGGVVTHKPTPRTGNVVAALMLKEAATDDMLALITRKGVAKPVLLSEISIMGRGVQGKPVIEINGSDTIAAIKRIHEATLPAVGVKELDSDGDKGKNGATPPAKPASRPTATATSGVTQPTKIQTALKMAPAKPEPSPSASPRASEKVVQGQGKTEVKVEKAVARAKVIESPPVSPTVPPAPSTTKLPATTVEGTVTAARQSAEKSAQRRTTIEDLKAQPVSSPDVRDQTVAMRTKPEADLKTPPPKPTSATAARTGVEKAPQTVQPAATKSVQSAPAKSENGAMSKLTPRTKPAPEPVEVIAVLERKSAVDLTNPPVQAKATEKRLPSKPVKVTGDKEYAQPELTQPALFAGEVEDKTTGARPRQAKKVQTVVSVPLGQSAKSKKAS
ncbi:hypothetical protein BH10CHL1_BH10CHL1_22390 [soil metagenome]